MADNKRWFKVWTSLLTDPDFDDIHNPVIGAWLRLGAVVALHGESGKITMSKTQLLKRIHMQSATEIEAQNMLNELSRLHVKVDNSCNGTCIVTFKNWHKYQVDSSAERVAKYRNSVTVQEEKRREENKKRKRREEIRGEKTARTFTKPTLKEIQDYCDSRRNGMDANKFFDFYESKGWMVGKNPMRDWQAAVRNWERGSAPGREKMPWETK